MRNILLILVLSAYCLDAHEAFEVQIRVMKSKETIQFKDINPDETTIGQLKELIAKKEGTQIENQRLIHAGKLIKDDSKLISNLGDYNPNSITLSLMDSLEKLGHVFVETGKIIKQVYVQGSETVEYLKDLVGIVSPSSLDHRRVFFDGVELENDHATLDEYGIYQGAHIRIFNQRDDIPVLVKTLTGELIHIEVETTVDIRGLKHMIEEREGTPVFEQRLVYKGQLLMDHSQVISFCQDPVEGLQVTMVNPLTSGGNIHVNLFGSDKLITLFVKDTDTIGDLKKRIKHDMSLGSEELSLNWQGRWLTGDDLKLRDYELFEGAVIVVKV